MKFRFKFQSLDQSQPVETTVLDNNNAAPATTEQAANEAKSDAPPAMEYVGDKADAAKSQPAEPAQQTVAQHSNSTSTGSTSCCSCTS